MNLKHTGLVLLSLAFWGCAKSKLSPVCPDECYTLNKGKGGVGECRSGAPQCDEDGKVIRCMGQKGPEAEVCDDKDNDCDGETDEYPQQEIVCPSLGVCASVEAKCLLGDWYCTNYPSTYEVQETLCDSLDNDCDGFADNNLFMGEYCYSGPPDTAGRYPCHPGARVCNLGQEECINEQTPEVEVCDQTDNDCNGLTDDLPNLVAVPVDFVLLLDASGSMDAEIGAVKAALSAFAAAHPATSYRFAIVNMCQGTTYLYRDFQDAFYTQTALSAFPGLGVSCGAENSLGTQNMICDETNPLGLSWNSAAQRILLGFTDENGQWYYPPGPVPAIPDQVQKCQESGTMCYWWHLMSVADFIPFCDQTGGKCFQLTESAFSMLADLNTVLEEICQ